MLDASIILAVQQSQAGVAVPRISLYIVFARTLLAVMRAGCYLILFL